MRRALTVSLGAVIVLSGLATFAYSSQASTRIHVVRPGHSIQAAVDSARPGDVIQLKAGGYYGGVLVRKRLTIRGVGDRTVIRPGGADHCASVQARGTGICVTGRRGYPVKGVTIERLSVRDFPANGIFGNFTDRLTVRRVLAKSNDEYGISEFNSTRGRFVLNRAVGSREEAALYVGDIANAHGTVVAWNHAYGSALGLLVRHARNVKAWGNDIDRNCTGIALVDDSQPGGQGNTRVWNNRVVGNNRNCPPHEEVPPLRGTGILLFGGDHNAIEKNTVKYNRGTLPYSGGIVVFRGTPPLNRPARYNTIKSNVAHRNASYDLVDRSGSNTDRFRANSCATSSPRGLC